MNPIDFLIIYLAGGAPFGVYYFFQNKCSRKSKIFPLEVFFIYIFWIPTAIGLLLQKIELRAYFKNKFGRKSISASASEKKCFDFQKRIEKIFFECRLNVSVYEFREIIERYTGLTIAVGAATGVADASEKNIFRAAKVENISTAARCLHRRNLNRLFYHQKLARRDFLTLIRKMLDFPPVRTELEITAFELVAHLGDRHAHSALVEIFGETLQINSNSPSIYTEKALWNNEQHKPAMMQ